MATIITIIVVVIGIMLSIVLHEFGHFLPARLFGVPCPEFSIGFGPKIASKKWRGTEWMVKGIWLGGYTQIGGMFPGPKFAKVKLPGNFGKIVEETRAESDKTIPPGMEAHAFFWLSAPKKILCMAGGILMNLLLGFICISIALTGIGGEQYSTILVIPECISTSSACGDSDPASPAFAAGIQTGDKLLELNGHPISSWDDVTGKVADGENQITVERDAEILSFDVTAIEIEKSPKLGIQSQPEHVTLSLAESAETTGQHVLLTANAVIGIPVQLVNSVISIFTGAPRGEGSLMSIVGLGQVAVASVNQADSFAQQAFTIFSLLGALNIGLFVLNLIPLLPLDGGHVVNALYEGIKRAIFKLRKKADPGPADLAAMQPIGSFMFMVLMGMGVILILADIINPIV